MKITIELKSGKKLELTEDEIQELMRMFGTQQVAPMPIYPIYPQPSWPVPFTVPDPYWTRPYITTCGNTTQ